jgi:hypothetical protein
MVAGTRIEIRNPVPQVRTTATAAATYLPMEQIDDDGRPRWIRAGVALPTWGCPQLEGLGEPADICVPQESAFEPNMTLDDLDCADFGPFHVRVQLEHKFVQTYSREELVEFLQSFALLHRSRIIAKEAMTANLTSNDSLVSVADTLTGIDLSAVGALAAVEEGLAQRIGNGIGMVHMTPGMTVLVKGALTADGNDLRTPSGHLVVADAGYAGGAPGAGAVTEGESWIYGSGPVYLETTPLLFNGAIAENYVMSTNTGTIDIQQYGILAFEPCSVVAAKVTATVIAA